MATITRCNLDLFDLHVFADGRATHVARSAELPATDEVIRIELRPGHSVRARLVDEDGKPLIDWDVHFLTDSSCWRTKSDASGEAESPGLPSGTRLTVSTSREDLDPTAALWQQLAAPLRKDVMLPTESVVELVVPKSAPTQIDLRWHPGDEGDELEVEVLQKLGNGTLASVQDTSISCAKGAAALTVPGPGVYLVEAVGSRSGTWRTNFVDAGSQKAPLALLEAQQPRSGTLLVRVSSPDGTPESGAVMTLRARNEGVGLQSPLRRTSASLLACPDTVRTDASGEYAWSNLVPGTYTLEIRAHDGSAWAESVSVSEDARVDVVLRATGAIEGVSVCAAGTDLLWAEVGHVDLDLHYRAPVDAAGLFRLEDLVPGSYELHLRTFDPMAALIGARPAPIRVEVRADEVTHCSIRTAARVSKMTLRVLGAHTPADRMDVQVERLHPHDRVGNSVWKVRRPIPPTRHLQLAEGPPPGRYGVSVLDRQTNALRGFSVVDVNPGSDCSCDVVVKPLVEVSIASRSPHAELRITPVDADGTMARD
ncbi:MAG: carboxypeptidase-like regulatory domain-containing protein, partial [Planctomycetota bacterium]